MRVQVLWTPAELEAVELEGRLAAVVDVVRATTSILVALEAGARKVFPTGSTDGALKLADSLGREDVLLCGEREGRKIEGFDLGNSPREFRPERVEGRTLVYTTTNGTRAIRRAADAKELVLASFRNLDAVAARARSRGLPLVVVCAGRAGRVGLDDALCAGWLVRRLSAGGDILPDDGAQAAELVARELGRPDAELLGNTAAGRAVVEIGLEADLEHCAEMNASVAVPTLADGAISLEGPAAD